MSGVVGRDAERGMHDATGTRTGVKETLHGKIMHDQAGNGRETDAGETANEVRTTPRQDNTEGMESPGATRTTKPDTNGKEASGERRTKRRKPD